MLKPEHDVDHSSGGGTVYSINIKNEKKVFYREL